MEQETGAGKEKGDDEENQSAWKVESDAEPEGRGFKGGERKEDIEQDDEVWNIMRNIGFIFSAAINFARIRRHPLTAQSIHTLIVFPDASTVIRPLSIANMFRTKYL